MIHFLKTAVFRVVVVIFVLNRIVWTRTAFGPRCGAYLWSLAIFQGQYPVQQSTLLQLNFEKKNKSEHCF